MIDFTTTTATSPTNPSGIYWTWQGIKEQLGLKNATVASDLDNDQDPSTAVADFDRVIADGTAADAYTKLRFTRGGNPYPSDELDDDGNIPSTWDHFELVRLAANLYASYLLVVHRIWEPPGTDEDRQRSRDDLYNRAMKLYDELFGAASTHDLSKPKPGTLQNVTMRFDPECNCDEFSSNC
jgi:hypothetical protein